MTYESDNPQFDHLINNLDSDEVPRKREATHTPEYHQRLLDLWHSGDVGFLPHQYRRCASSGAGNCCCGRDDRAALHNDGARQR